MSEAPMPDMPGGDAAPPSFTQEEDAPQKFFDWLWGDYVEPFIRYAAEKPYEFIWYFFLCLTPLFMLSALFSYLLMKAIEKQEKEERKKQTRAANIARRKKKAE